MAGGADRPGYLAIHSGPGSYRRVSGNATNRRFVPGDLVWMDGGPILDGYWSDITRMAAIGTRRPEDASRYAFAWNAVQELISDVAPGITAGDIARRGSAYFARHGHPMGGASRIGHGIGVELTEPPSIVDGDETELVEGMTLSVETGIAAWDGKKVRRVEFIDVIPKSTAGKILRKDLRARETAAV
jgi:Xaa-Pro aminopeptidase